MPRLKYRVGHEIYWDDEIQKWRWKDDGTIREWYEPRDCPKCGLNPKDFGGHDPCIANLPGVRSACCGHGVRDGYIQFWNGVKIKGRFSVRKDDINEKPGWFEGTKRDT